MRDRAAGAANVVVLSIDHGLTRRGRASAAVVGWARARAAAIVRRVGSSGGFRSGRGARLAMRRSTLADELGLACALIGHTARDQAETVVPLRGTARGSGRIPPARTVHPAARHRRDVIDAYVPHRLRSGTIR
jgi:tRNA(Ile)-lysidine synthase TilS/MesJ